MKQKHTILTPDLKQDTPRTAEVKQFIDAHQYLFWYSPAPKSETVSDDIDFSEPIEFMAGFETKEQEIKNFLIDKALEDF
jgi:hypothetical protein